MNKAFPTPATKAGEKRADSTVWFVAEEPLAAATELLSVDLDPEF
jgi:hypothetical protein